MLEVYREEKLAEEYRRSGLDDDAVQNLRKCFAGMANLYGAISVSSAYRLLENAMDNPPTPEQYAEFVEVARHDNAPFLVLHDSEIFETAPDAADDDKEPHILHPALLAVPDGTMYAELRSEQEGKPIYMASLRQLQHYAKALYVEKTPEAKNLVRFLRLMSRQSTGSAQDGDSVRDALGHVRQYAQFARGDGRLEGAVRVLADDSVLPDPSSLPEHTRQVLMLHVAEYLNHIRHWTNGGYTPQELMDAVQNYSPDSGFHLRIAPHLIEEARREPDGFAKLRENLSACENYGPAALEELLRQVDDLARESE